MSNEQQFDNEIRERFAAHENASTQKGDWEAVQRLLDDDNDMPVMAGLNWSASKLRLMVILAASIILLASSVNISDEKSGPDKSETLLISINPPLYPELMRFLDADITESILY